MKIYNNYNYIQATMENGDALWACGRGVTLPPAKGVLALTDNKHLRQSMQKYNHLSKTEFHMPIWYFVPLDAATGTPVWDRSARMDNRYFATTEAECQDIHKEILESKITELQRQIAIIRSYLTTNKYTRGNPTP